MGGNVLLVEREKIGGICPNWGCIPMCFMDHCVEVIRTIKQADRQGISAGKIEIDYPKLLLPDIAILMSQPAFLKFHKDLKKDGVLIIDNDLVNPSDIKEDIKLYSIPSTQIAQSLGNKIVANVVMLGALVAITGVVTKEDMIKSIKTTLPERVLELNLGAFEKGFEAGKKSKNLQS